MEWKGVIKGVWWSNLLTTSILIIYLLTHSLTLPPAPPPPPYPSVCPPPLFFFIGAGGHRVLVADTSAQPLRGVPCGLGGLRRVPWLPPRPPPWAGCGVGRGASDQNVN